MNKSTTTVCMTQEELDKDIYLSICATLAQSRWTTTIQMTGDIIPRRKWSAAKPTKRQLRKWVKSHKKLASYYIY